jgi:hypothetical protein
MILTQTYFISLFQALQLSLVLFWISFSFYVAAEITADEEIVSPVICILFGIIGLKLNEINKNYAFGSAVDNKYKISIINLYLPLYFKDKHEELNHNNNTSFTFSENNSNNASINGTTINDNNIGIIFSVKEKIISKITSQYLLSTLIEDYFMKSMNLNFNKLNLGRKYYQALSMNIKNEVSEMNEVNVHDTFSISVVNKGLGTLLNSTDTLKNQFVYSNLLFNRTNISLSSAVLQKTEFIGFSGDLSAHQILKSIEDSYLLEINSEKFKRENEVSNLKHTNTLALFSSCYVLYDNLNLRENIICGLTSKEYFKRISNNEYSNRLYSSCVEICSLSIMTNLNATLENSSNKECIKISYARSIFKDAEIILIDDILQTISDSGVEVLNAYFKSDIFNQKPRLIICASNRIKFLEKCSNILLVKEDKVIGNYQSYNDLNLNETFSNEFREINQ